MKIVVLKGGVSTERDVSLASGAYVAESLRIAGHAVAEVDAPADLKTAGREPAFLTTEDAPVAAWQVERDPPTSHELARLASVMPAAAVVTGLVEVCRHADVVFIALHGGAGEDGTVQAVLEHAGIPHTGGESLGCALPFNKAVAKTLMQAAGVATPAWQLVRDGASEFDVACVGGRYPVVVKPAKGGSTVGVSLADSESETKTAIRQTLGGFGPAVLVEEYVDGREFTVGILGGQPLPVVEMRFDDRIFDYGSKYQPGQADEICPADLPNETSRELQQIASRVHEILGIGPHAYSRVDFRLDADGRPFCLEANVLPGLTRNSLFPLATRAAGMAFPEVCDRIVALGLQARAGTSHGLAAASPRFPAPPAPHRARDIARPRPCRVSGD